MTISSTGLMAHQLREIIIIGTKENRTMLDIMAKIVPAWSTTESGMTTAAVNRPMLFVRNEVAFSFLAINL